jgi:hypothetical protein
MTEWYYAKDGQQNGPVSYEELVQIASNGGLNPTKDLVWNKSMKDWIVAGQVPGLYTPSTGSTGPPADPSNPYASPTAGWNEVAQTTAGESLEEIVPGSDPLDVMACAKRGFNLTIRHFGMILLIGIVYAGVGMGAGLILGAMDSALGLGQPVVVVPRSGQTPQELQIQAFATSFQNQGSGLHQILNQVLSLFLSIGLTRIGLNLVSGRPISVGMLFGGGRKLLPMIGGYLIFMAAFLVGLVFLVVPGIYIATRYGQFFYAIVDRDLSIMDSFQYSSSITTNNRMNIVLLWLLYFAMAFAGILALCIGIFFAMPVIWLTGVVAYRWLQYGHRAALDHHGTQTPMLAKL